MKKISLITLSFILTISLVSLSFTQAEARWRENPMGGPIRSEENFTRGRGPGEGRMLSGWDNLRHLGRYLDLSIEQRQKIHKIRFDFLKKTLDLENELGEKRLLRRALMEKDVIDWKKTDQLTDETAKIQANLQKIRMRQRQEIKKILTPEQIEQFEEMKNQRGRSGISGKRFGQGQGPGRGMCW